MKHLLEFAMFSDILKNPDNNKIINKYINNKFNDNERLIFDVFLKKYDKHIILDWNNTKKHPIIHRIKTRTSFKSTSDFNEFISKAINDLFNNHFDELTVNDNVYALFFTERKFSLIIDIRNDRKDNHEIGYDNLFKNLPKIFIGTIISLPNENEYKIIQINDEYF